MNQELRKYLIECCKVKKPIYYEEVGRFLNLNLSTDLDRSKLSNALGEISEFEFKHSRPLLSAIAIYKEKNDHGYGFYSLCEDLSIGKSKELKESLFGFTQLEECKKFWSDPSNYEKYKELNFKIYDDKNAPPFFNLEEISFFKSWINKLYDPQNHDHVNAKNYILDSVWHKTKFWSNEIITRLIGFETLNDRKWSKRGWVDGNAVSMFKPYTWARLYKQGDRDKNIFFTIGVDPENDALIYKLDYYRESGDFLSAEQQSFCDKYIPTELKWNEISFEELVNYDWERLISLTLEFINNNVHHYEQVVQLAWGDLQNNKDHIFNNFLTLRAYPSGGLKELPLIKPSFKGYQTDFIKQNVENKELGDSGERLVKEFEFNKLRNRGSNDLAEKVHIAKDGEGYDVFSYDEFGNEKYIEVKTTTGNEKTPFHLSINEYKFCEQNSKQYCIYRLYNYNDEMGHADYFVIDDPLDKLLFQPVNYLVYLKENKS